MAESGKMYNKTNQLSSQMTNNWTKNWTNNWTKKNGHDAMKTYEQITKKLETVKIYFMLNSLFTISSAFFYYLPNMFVNITQIITFQFTYFVPFSSFQFTLLYYGNY